MEQTEQLEWSGQTEQAKQPDQMSQPIQTEQFEQAIQAEQTTQPEPSQPSIDGKTTEEVLVYGNKEELNMLKARLFDESIRVDTACNQLEQMQQKFLTEKKQFQEEMKELNRKIVAERKRLKEDTSFFDKKMEILKSGFSQLDMDKRKLEKEKLQFLADKEVASRDITYGRHSDTAELFFKGVNSPLSLKKRYKDLIKMYHPDNIAGDHDMVLLINRIFEKMRAEFEYERQA